MEPIYQRKKAHSRKKNVEDEKLEMEVSIKFTLKEIPQRESRKKFVKD